jgi:hypothetical protein
MSALIEPPGEPPHAPETADDTSPLGLHQNLIAIGRPRLELATVAGKKPLMKIRHTLFLCLLAVTLAVTGPLSRGLSAQAAMVLQTTEAARAGEVTNLKTGAAPFKRCQRGAVAGQAAPSTSAMLPKARNSAWQVRARPLSGCWMERQAISCVRDCSGHRG